MNCIVCDSDSKSRIVSIPCSSFDNSVLYKTIRLVYCNTCGHIYNDLTKEEIRNLNRYYKTEYKSCNANSTKKRLDDIRKDQIYEFLVDEPACIIYDQKLEHMTDADDLFRRDLVCIGVPDALRYYESDYFKPYWLIMREHIQHFDLHHLLYLAARHGYSMAKPYYGSMPIMSKTMIMPVLEIQ